LADQTGFSDSADDQTVLAAQNPFDSQFEAVVEFRRQILNGFGFEVQNISGKRQRIGPSESHEGIIRDSAS
jgi:hypothetical protein